MKQTVVLMETEGQIIIQYKYYVKICMVFTLSYTHTATKGTKRWRKEKVYERIY